MRDYAKVSPRFWTGDTGRRVRALGHRTQVVAMYLLTCPNANMLGLYYLPLPTLCHETGSPFEGASEALRSLREANFAFYDEASETVFVPEMARHQLGETISRKDNRHAAVVKELEHFRKSPFFNEFLSRYRDAFHLHDIAPSEALASPSEAPSKPLARGFPQEQEQEQEIEQEQERESTRAGGKGKGARGKAPRPSKRVPDSFAVTPELRSWAAEHTPHVDLERETAAMRDYEFRRPYSDWPAVWRRWMTRASESQGAITNGRRKTSFERADDALEQWRQERSRQGGGFLEGDEGALRLPLDGPARGGAVAALGAGDRVDDAGGGEAGAAVAADERQGTPADAA